MEIRFCGAAQTVTGSQFLVTVNKKQFLLECGLFQGRRTETYERNLNFLYEPSSVGTLVLSHAHMDHSGNIPNLVKKGFTGTVYATPSTVDLCKIMLRDSAHVQQSDVEWVNRIRAKHHQEPVEPLYTTADAESAMDFFAAADYNRPFTVAPGATAVFLDAGHILGSAGIQLDIEENGRKFRVGFAGDIGRPNMPIIRDPNHLRDLDVLMMECTYGNRVHGPFDEIEERLAGIIRQAAAGGGKILVPSFAIGRTQMLIYLLHKLFDQNRIPEIPVYVDSPLAVQATEIYRNHPEDFDRETNRVFVRSHEDPFGFRRLTFVQDTAESKKLNALSFPHIIISSSGMCEGGRILHHLRNNIEDPRCTILFVGYAARNTLARKIMDGEECVRIFGEQFRVKARVEMMDSFSAHGDRHDLLNYVKTMQPDRLKHIILVHG